MNQINIFEKQLPGVETGVQLTINGVSIQGVTKLALRLAKDQPATLSVEYVELTPEGKPIYLLEDGVPVSLKQEKRLFIGEYKLDFQGFEAQC